MAMTVGELCATHIGMRFTLDAPEGGSSQPGIYEGEVVRVQHNAPTQDLLGDEVPAQTLLVLGSWSGPLNSSWPIEIVED